ncbi:MAG: hypothetical protein Q7U04_11195, partial [Bacteriovorax sp.]|nr:hypothetical protein [Bacteriovorax sp.]
IELIDKISTEILVKRAQKDKLQNNAMTVEKELLQKREIYQDLHSCLQDNLRKIDELSSSKNMRKNELEDMSQKLIDDNSALELSFIDLEKLKIDLDLVEQVRITKSNLLEKLNLELSEIVNQINTNKFNIAQIENELASMSKEIQKNSNEFEKLKELEMLTALTLDHVQKEGSQYSQRILKTEQNVKNKQKDLKSLTSKLAEQQIFFESIKKNEKKSSQVILTLTELVERTRLLVLSNQSFLARYEVESQTPPKLPQDC